MLLHINIYFFPISQLSKGTPCFIVHIHQNHFPMHQCAKENIIPTKKENLMKNRFNLLKKLLPALISLFITAFFASLVYYNCMGYELKAPFTDFSGLDLEALFFVSLLSTGYLLIRLGTHIWKEYTLN